MADNDLTHSSSNICFVSVVDEHGTGGWVWVESDCDICTPWWQGQVCWETSRYDGRLSELSHGDGQPDHVQIRLWWYTVFVILPMLLSPCLSILFISSLISHANIGAETIEQSTWTAELQSRCYVWVDNWNGLYIILL